MAGRRGGRNTSGRVRDSGGLCGEDRVGARLVWAEQGGREVGVQYEMLTRYTCKNKPL